MRSKMLEVDSAVCKAEWSNLHYDLLPLIAISLGPFGYPSLCLVCKDWRNAILKASPAYKFSRCDPCFLLYGEENSQCSLLSDNDKVYTIDIPELVGATCLASYEGWLLVFRGGSLFFFCPFSRAKIELPNCPFTELTDHIAAFSAAPTSHDCIVVVINRNNGILQSHMLCRGDNIWAKHIVSSHIHPYFPETRVAYFIEGKFIFWDKNGSVTYAVSTKQWKELHHPEQWDKIMYPTVRSKGVKRKLGLNANVPISTCGTLHTQASDKFPVAVIKSEYTRAATVFESGHLKGVWVLPRYHHIPPHHSW